MDSNTIIVSIIGAIIGWIIFYVTVKVAVKNGIIEGISQSRLDKTFTKANDPFTQEQIKLQERYDKGEISFEEYKDGWKNKS